MALFCYLKSLIADYSPGLKLFKKMILSDEQIDIRQQFVNRRKEVQR